MFRAGLAALVVAALTGSGCLGGDDDDGTRGPAGRALKGAQAQPPAPATAGALAQIADVAPARRRLAFVDLAALDGLPVRRGALLDGVLRGGAANVGGRTDGTVVQVGAAVTVVQGGGAPQVTGAGPALARRLADPRPARSAIAPSAPSAVQACLGQTVAQTILGPDTMGRDAALGAGLAQPDDPAAGPQLRICAAPRLRRDVDGAAAALRRRLARTEAVVAGAEIGEREIVGATVPASELSGRALVALLGGGAPLRALGWA